jgi:hypothetical protein
MKGCKRMANFKSIKANNAVEPAIGKFKHKGFKVGKVIPSKGGDTNNSVIPESMFAEELKLKNSGVCEYG